MRDEAAASAGARQKNIVIEVGVMDMSFLAEDDDSFQAEHLSPIVVPSATIGLKTSPVVSPRPSTQRYTPHARLQV